jgi:hypothetical protein
MHFISNRIFRYWQSELKYKSDRVVEQAKIILNLTKENNDLREQLSQARNLKAILENLYPLHHVFGSVVVHGSNGISLNLPADVARIMPDHFGGNVIKQDATKVVVLDKNGNAKTAYTKKQADKGFSYLLVREK